LKTTIKKIIEKAINSGKITPDEIRELFLVPEISEESYAIQFAARKMSEDVMQGKAEVHAQVGINIGPCPKNCLFCSFAVVNRIFPQTLVLPVDQVIEKCLGFEEAGANAIYLMSTASLDLEEYLRTGYAVREVLRPETVLVANVGDFDDDGAKAIRNAGFQGVYHAVRLGEGISTGIDVRKRLRTVKAAKNAGLLVGTCVEPVGPEHSVEELVEKTLLAREMDPVFSGAARRITIPGTRLAAQGMVNESRMALILAVVRLATGFNVLGNCTHEPNGIGAMAGANLFWAEQGANPRDTEKETEASRGFSVAKCREIFREAGWDVLDGPSRMYSRV
jgi:biotin synthase